ncbi:hypothetical protein AAHA92_21377 [Salvia divinorum]|uniref:Uncharacterized protein n=1 Tax=Salvia divinorum TaxID=28513 RepID=A0ABD1GNA5_SALDI
MEKEAVEHNQQQEKQQTEAAEREDEAAEKEEETAGKEKEVDEKDKEKEKEKEGQDEEYQPVTNSRRRDVVVFAVMHPVVGCGGGGSVQAVAAHRAAACAAVCVGKRQRHFGPCRVCVAVREGRCVAAGRQQLGFWEVHCGTEELGQWLHYAGSTAVTWEACVVVWEDHAVVRKACSMYRECKTW